MDNNIEIIDYPDDVELLCDAEFDAMKTDLNHVISTLLENSSIPSLSRIGQSKTIQKKIFWFLIFIACLCGGCYETNSFLRVYLQYPVLMDIGVVRDTSLKFPAVTICNLNNVVSYHAQCVFENASWHTCKSLTGRRLGYRLINTFRKKHVNWWRQFKNKKAQKAQDFMKRYLNLDGESRKRYGHRYEDVIKKCTFKSEMCNKLNFTHYLSVQFGNCFTFKTKSHDIISEGVIDDSLNGLELYLNVQGQDYLPFTPESGFRVVIHDPEDDPNPEESGFNVSPGFETHVRMQKSTLYRLPAPYRDHCKEYEYISDDDKINDESGCLNDDGRIPHLIKYSPEDSKKTTETEDFVVNRNIVEPIKYIRENFKLMKKTKDIIYFFEITTHDENLMNHNKTHNQPQNIKTKIETSCRTRDDNPKHQKDCGPANQKVQNHVAINQRENIFPNYEAFIQKQHQIEENGENSQTDCIRKCLLKYTLEACSCVDPFLPHSSYPTCDLKSETEMDCLDNAMVNLENNGFPCNCPLPCSSTTYNLKMFSSVLPYIRQKNASSSPFKDTQDYSEFLVNISDAIQHSQRSKTSNGDELKLKVYFQSYDHTVYHQRAMFSDTELLAHIGGSLSLWLGLSLVSFVECIENVYHIIQFCKKQARKKLETINNI